MGLKAAIGPLVYKSDPSNLGHLAQWGHWDYIGARDERGTGVSRGMCHDAGRCQRLWNGRMVRSHQ